MDFVRLRELLSGLVLALKDSGTHEELPAICSRLALPVSGTELGSKRDRMRASFDALPDSELPTVAERLLEQYPPTASNRNAIQDILWSRSAWPEIPKRF